MRIAPIRPVAKTDPQKHSATERNMFAGSAAYRNWALKFPQHEYVGPDRDKVQTKTAPARGLFAPGFRMTLVL